MGNVCVGPRFSKNCGFFGNFSLWPSRSRNSGTPSNPTTTSRSVPVVQVQPSESDAKPQPAQSTAAPAPVVISEPAQLSQPQPASKPDPSPPLPASQQHAQAQQQQASAPRQQSRKKAAHIKRISSAGLQVESVLRRKTDNLKDLLRKVLVRDPKKRLTAHQVLCHPWLQTIASAPDKPLDSAVLSRLKQFSAMNKLKKMALRVIAENLSEEEIAGLKEMFKMMDTDNSGQINFEELKAGLEKVGANMKESEIYQLMQAADIDNSGTIDYGEFIAATLHLNKIEREDHLFAAFQYFDKDGSGYITADELQQACDEFGIEDIRLEDMIGEVDQDNDGRIDYNEFVAMMQKPTAGYGKKGHRYNLSIGFRDALKANS
ncbi:Calcium-dependent protein kinase 1 [Zea mays]|uniref:non-specific serine/threonine protein kinase n=1 Tax=Zea mays TaxID=4577 RepID=A0A1D6MTQ4_MAIZE|nr:Calcium-dependent protein kinase 1 [Zea mays]